MLTPDVLPRNTSCLRVNDHVKPPSASFDKLHHMTYNDGDRYQPLRLMLALPADTHINVYHHNLNPRG
ncbi:unnamed protein product, partial [Aphanomyces euteiches]